MVIGHALFKAPSPDSSLRLLVRKVVRTGQNVTFVAVSALHLLATISRLEVNILESFIQSHYRESQQQTKNSSSGDINQMQKTSASIQNPLKKGKKKLFDIRRKCIKAGS
jgi:hypothetical protein